MELGIRLELKADLYQPSGLMNNMRILSTPVECVLKVYVTTQMRPGIIHHNQKLRIKCATDSILKCQLQNVSSDLWIYHKYSLFSWSSQPKYNMYMLFSSVSHHGWTHTILTAHQSQKQTANDSFVTISYIMYHSQFFSCAREHACLVAFCSLKKW